MRRDDASERPIRRRSWKAPKPGKRCRGLHAYTGRMLIYHNPRCSKSREALALLEARGLTPQVVLYLEQPPTLDELTALQRRLGVPAREMLRNGESAYDTLHLADAALSDRQLLRAITDHPVLLQRPIVVDGERALIARPPELLNEWLVEGGHAKP